MVNVRQLYPGFSSNSVPTLIIIKLIYSEKATKCYEISTLLLSVCTANKSKAEILQNFVAFPEYMNFNFFFESRREVFSKLQKNRGVLKSRLNSLKIFNKKDFMKIDTSLFVCNSKRFTALFQNLAIFHRWTGL